MKKIININLSGRVIPIEDSAYEKLKSYIESLRRYFVKEEDRDEIINDIESRIAELMNEKIRKGAACITDADIDEIAASMGRPEDFEAEAAEADYSSTQGGAVPPPPPGSERKSRGRLYRDTNDKFIGGVCSGIAAYLNVDPSIVRILFAIITFGGLGIGFFAYILLWIVLPARGVENLTSKRLYRNPDDRVIGGVAGGLAAYFKRETWVIRLVFAAPLLFSIFIGFIRGITWHHDFDFVPNMVFGSLTSTFIITYIILWIVLPEARSTYEKMEMRGEKVDVNSIRQNMKERVKEWSEEVKESAQNLSDRARDFANTRGKTFAAEVGETARTAGSGCGHAIGVLFKVFFLFIAGTIAFSLFVGLMALIFGGIAWWPINNFLWTSSWQQVLAWGTLIFFLLVPLVGFIIWLIRRIIKVRRSKHSYLGWTFGFLWTVGWVCVVLFTISVGRDLRVRDHAPDKEIVMTQPANGKMIVVVSEPELEYTGRFNWANERGEGWDLTEDVMKVSWVDFDIDKSPDSLYHVAIRKYSHGRDHRDAIDRAENIEYTATSVDSLLDLGSGYAIHREDKFRLQRVEVMIKVPVGKRIRFDESVRRKLDVGSNARYRNYRVHGRKVDIVYNDRVSFWWSSNVDYIMQADGKLADVAGRYVDDDNYRYEQEEKVPDTLDVKQQLEEEKRKREESDKRIKDLEKKQKEKQKPAARTAESMDDTEEDVTTASPSPVFSLVKSFF